MKNDNVNSTSESSGSFGEKTGQMLPVDSWSYLEIVQAALAKIKPRLQDDRPGLDALKEAEDAVAHLVESVEMASNEAMAWAASL